MSIITLGGLKKEPVSLEEERIEMNIFRKYLSGGCSKEENAYVENWLKLSPENQSFFDEYKQIWKDTGCENNNAMVDVDRGWIELNRRIDAIETLTADLQYEKRLNQKRFLYNVSRVAAVVIIVFGIFYLSNSIKNQEAENLHFVSTEMLDQPLLLADGSKVFLNKEAGITYPEKFTSEERKIDFEGEAFFNVAHNPDKPFIISSGELQVEVLGTSFNFCTCPDGDEMVLYLESGKVRFSSINTKDGTIREQLILTPGQKGVFNKKSGAIHRSEFKNQNYLAWRTGILEFDKTPLNEVLTTVEKTFKIKVVSEDSFNNLSLTAKFVNETPESIFESIQTIFGIEYEFVENTVLLN